MSVYKRKMEVEVFVLDSKSAKAVSRLEIGSSSEGEKNIYQIWVKINMEKMEIEDAGMDYLTPEVPECMKTKDLIKGLKGLGFGDRYLFKVFKRIGGKNGCQHLLELAIEIARALTNLKVGEYLKPKKSLLNNSISVSNNLLMNLEDHCLGLSYIAKDKRIK